MDLKQHLVHIDLKIMVIFIWIWKFVIFYCCISKIWFPKIKHVSWLDQQNAWLWLWLWMWLQKKKINAWNSLSCLSSTSKKNEVTESIKYKCRMFKCRRIVHAVTILIFLFIIGVFYVLLLVWSALGIIIALLSG